MSDHYQQLVGQQKIINDRVRGVIHGESNGCYLYGRPGTSKTYTVRTTLDRLGVNYVYRNGHLTEIGLFELLAEHADQIIVLDDLSALFNKPIALQLLMAALGNPHTSSRRRYVDYKTAKGETRVPFTGGIIGISNLPLDGHHKDILAALRDRVYCVNYEPTDEQIVALMTKIAETGFPDVTPTEAQMVLTCLLEQIKAREGKGVRPSIRLLVDKAIPDFRLHKAGNSETHWRDLIASNLEQQVIELQHETKDLSRAEQVEAERRIVIDICLTAETRTERLVEWERRTGKSRAAYDRRVTELKKDGRLPKAKEKAEELDAEDTKPAMAPAASIAGEVFRRIERVGKDGKKRVDYRPVKNPKKGERYYVKQDGRWVKRALPSDAA